MSRYIDADALSEYVEKQYMGFIGNPTWDDINSAPSIDIVWCKECIWFDTDNTGEGYCTYVKGLADAKADDFCSYGSRSEKPNNCEHITEDGVTCAKYPACDDCIDNPLNKVKGSERLVKGSERSSE